MTNLTPRGVCKDLEHTPYVITDRYKFTSKKKMQMFERDWKLNYIKAKSLLEKVYELTGIHYIISDLMDDVKNNTYVKMEHK